MGPVVWVRGVKPSNVVENLALPTPVVQSPPILLAVVFKVAEKPLAVPLTLVGGDGFLTSFPAVFVSVFKVQHSRGRGLMPVGATRC